MKYLLLTAIVILGYLVLPSTSSAADASAEQYAVYSAVIANTFDKETKLKQLVIQDLTATDGTAIENLREEGRYFERTFPTLKPEVITDYKTRNKEPLRLTASFDLKIKYVMVTDKEIEKIFNRGGGWWEDFYKKCPDSGGFISLSRPGFNAAMDQALVYIGHFCGGLCGTGHYALLEKRDHRWMVVRQNMVWIS